MHRLIAIVGMAGAGKSTTAAHFQRAGYAKVRFGDATMEELQRREMEVNEENESLIRETLRLELGMDAYAKLNEPKLKEALRHKDVVIDGLYSWQEYTYLKPKFPQLNLLAVYASPKTRYRRLASRPERPLGNEEAAGRDYAEIENLNKADPIAMADYAIMNEGSLEELKLSTERMIRLVEHEKPDMGRILH